MKFGSFLKGIKQTGSVWGWVLRKILGPRTQQVIAVQRTLHNEGLYRILHQTLQTPSNTWG
jgi:hypothetical protein